MLNTLFLDQTGKLGGAELSLLDIAKSYKEKCLVGLFEDGSFRSLLEEHEIPVQVLTTQLLQVRKESNLLQGLGSLRQLLPLIAHVTKLSRSYDLIYANTQKALVVGAIASFLSNRPFVYHLHDILTPEHFSRTNIKIAVTLANRFASLIIANSRATQAAFVAAGGRADLTQVVYNGFNPAQYCNLPTPVITTQLGNEKPFVVGHFSRLSPWKGQHVLIEALTHCPEDVVAVFVGEALFGEQAYADQLHQQVTNLGLEKRVQFLGFRSDVPKLMTACDMIAHTSTASEPFGRVIVEAMLCGRPVVAAQAGGALELVESGRTGWLTSPGDAQQLAEVLNYCRSHPEETATIARNAQLEASQRFDHVNIEKQITRLLEQTQNRQ